MSSLNCFSNTGANMNIDPTGAKERVFLTCLFFYHLIITSAAPIARMVYKQWYAVLPYFNNSKLGIAFMPVYPTTDEMEVGQRGDRAFNWHALVSISWMICGYIQLVWTTRSSAKSRKYHKYFGYISLLCYLGHCMASLNIWYADVEQHSLLNRVLLFFAMFAVAMSVFEGMKGILFAKLTGRKITAQDIMHHRYQMCQAYIHSLNGAGTIRTVALIHTNLNVGVLFCQVKHLRVGGICDWTYTWRLQSAATLSLIQRAIYIKCKKSRFDAEFIRDCRDYAAYWVLMLGSYYYGMTQTECLVLCAMFKMLLIVFDQYGSQLQSKYNESSSIESNTKSNMLTVEDVSDYFNKKQQ